jgi:hypothetical protein
MREFYDGDIKADSKLTMRTPQYIYELATFYRWLKLPGDAKIDWVTEQIRDHHRGQLIGLDGKPILKDHLMVHECFGCDTRRTMNAFLKNAECPPKQLLHRHLVARIMWLDFARMIYVNRME